MHENADQNNSEYGQFLRSGLETTAQKLSVFGVILQFHVIHMRQSQFIYFNRFLFVWLLDGLGILIKTLR